MLLNKTRKFGFSIRISIIIKSFLLDHCFTSYMFALNVFSVHERIEFSVSKANINEQIIGRFSCLVRVLGMFVNVYFGVRIHIKGIDSFQNNRT